MQTLEVTNSELMQSLLDSKRETSDAKQVVVELKVQHEAHLREMASQQALALSSHTHIQEALETQVAYLNASLAVLNREVDEQHRVLQESRTHSSEDRAKDQSEFGFCFCFLCGGVKFSIINIFTT